MLSLSCAVAPSHPGAGLTHIGLKEISSEERMKLAISSTISGISGVLAINIALDPSVRSLGVMQYAVSIGLLMLCVKSIRNSRRASKMADCMEEILEESIARAKGTIQ